jgi:hypothetical protein
MIYILFRLQASGRLLAHLSCRVLIQSRILDVAHLVLICQSCYHYLISNWGNNAALMVSTQELDLHLVFVGMASAICQAFFLSRCVVFVFNFTTARISVESGHSARKTGY